MNLDKVKDRLRSAPPFKKKLKLYVQLSLKLICFYPQIFTDIYRRSAWFMVSTKPLYQYPEMETKPTHACSLSRDA